MVDLFTMLSIQVLSLVHIFPILWVQSYTTSFPNSFRCDQQKSILQLSSVSPNDGTEWESRSLSSLFSQIRNFDDGRAESTNVKATTLLERKSFIKGSAVASCALLGLQPAWSTTIDPKTGIRLPDPGEIEAAIPSNWENEENPISFSGTAVGSESNSNTQFARLDNKPDSIFYEDARFVEHVDENAVKLMTDYISNTAIQPGRDTAILDLCSSWTSHIEGNIAGKVPRISALGMNAKELDRNTALTDWIVQDLNNNPQLSKYENESFDVVLCQLSIDYLTKPLQVLKEVGRILKVGGQVHIIFSNRLFLSKAVGLWTGGDDIDHAYYVGSYLHFCDGGFEDIKAKDLSNRKGGKDKRIVGDPLFVVSATKRK